MANSGLDYLLSFSKIQKNEKIGEIEAIDFETINNGTQMGRGQQIKMRNDLRC